MQALLHLLLQALTAAAATEATTTTWTHSCADDSAGEQPVAAPVDDIRRALFPAPASVQLVRALGGER